jgi:gas vesicle protein
MFDLFGNEKLRREQERHSRNLMVLTSISAFVGAVTALLFSPGSGKQNRQFVADKSKNAYKSAQHATQDAGKSIQTLEKDLKNKFDQLKTAIEKKVGNGKDEIQLIEEEDKEKGKTKVK